MIHCQVQLCLFSWSLYLALWLYWLDSWWGIHCQVSCVTSHNHSTWHTGCIDFTVCEWFTARSSCVPFHNHSIWHSGCIDLKECEWFTARSSCISSHNPFTWHSGCIDLTACEWFTSSSSCVFYHNPSTRHSDCIDLAVGEWSSSSCASSHNSSIWHLIVLAPQCVSNSPVLGLAVPLLIILLSGTLVVLTQSVWAIHCQVQLCLLIILLPGMLVVLTCQCVSNSWSGSAVFLLTILLSGTLIVLAW